ncbi:hypothetical protein [Mangrovibacterium lignilyticum]|uniref:hypothetical protein n=1 Tax=Mangrovibacterium lignilyticum TaxID=2668052 RepID=UPI0013D2FD58|nr:hypothetical protein [Mangrovibacterium lignilyticum]
MKTIFLITVIAFSGILSVSAQERAGDDLRSGLGLYSGDVMNFYNEVARNKAMESFDLSLVDGSPYLNNEFVTGDIVTKDSVQYAGLKLRYNIYNDAIEFEKGDLAIELNPNFPLLYAVIGDDIFVKAEDKDGFFRVVSTGKVYLVEKMKIKYNDAKPASGYQAAKRPSFRSLNSDYYIQSVPGGEATELSNKNDVMSIFSDSKSEVAGFIKSEKIKIDKAEDLKKLVAYYNSLQ